MKKRILLTLLIIALMLSVSAVCVMAAPVTGLKTPRIAYDADGNGVYTDAGDYAPQTAYELNSAKVAEDLEFDLQTVTAVGPTSITISGLKSGMKIAYSSTEGSGSVSMNSTTLPSGDTYEITGLTEGATYTLEITWNGINIGGNLYLFSTKSDAIYVTTKSKPYATENEGKWPTPTGISGEGGKLLGTDANRTYEYAKLNAPEFTAPTTYTVYDPSTTTLTGGLYYVRVVEGADANYKYKTSDSALVYVKGENAGTFSNAGNVSTPTVGHWIIQTDDLNYLAATRVGNSAGKGYFATQIPVSSSAQATFNNGYYAYYYADDEIIPVIDLLDFSFKKTTNTGDHIIHKTNNKDFKVQGVVRFYIYGGNKAVHEVPFEWKPWNNNANIKIDLSSVVQPGDSGYVYRMDIDLIAADTLDEANLRPAEASDFPSGALFYQQLSFLKVANSRVEMTVRAPEAAPEISAEGTGVDNVYRIVGLNPAKRYKISNDGVNYTDIPANSSYYDVTGTGTYYVVTCGGDKTLDSAPTTKKIAGAMPEISEGQLYYENGVIKGFNTIPDGLLSVTYQWCQIKADGTYAWDKSLVSSPNATLQVSPGYYAFRYKAQGDSVSGKAYTLFVYEGGTNKGTVSIAVPESGNLKDFYPGRWTSSCDRIRNNGPTKTLVADYSPNVTTAPQMCFMYQFADNEIFTLSEFATLSFKLDFFNGNPFNFNYYPGFVRIHVIEGDQAYYDVPFTANYNAAITVNIADFWTPYVEADENFELNGYVSAIEIHGFSSDRIDGLEVRNSAYNGPRLVVTGADVNTMTSSKFITLKQPASSSPLNSVPAIGSAGGEITGLNPEATYQFATYDEATGTQGSWISVPTNTTTIKNLEKGTYIVRSFALANDPKFITSETQVVEVGEIPADGRDTAKIDKLVLPEDVVFAEAEYTFDIDESRWISRLAISNIVETSPEAKIVFAAEDYRYIVSVSDIDLTLDNAHYFDMKVTFDGESAYDRMYPKMKAIADEKELIKGIHFETSTGYFFENAIFEVNLGEKYNGYEVELRSYNKRVNRLRKEETVFVEDGWASFTTFGEDYVVLSPTFAEEAK
jgi:hypothetical protein